MRRYFVLLVALSLPFLATLLGTIYGGSLLPILIAVPLAIALGAWVLYRSSLGIVAKSLLAALYGLSILWPFLAWALALACVRGDCV